MELLHITQRQAIEEPPSRGAFLVELDTQAIGAIDAAMREGRKFFKKRKSEKKVLAVTGSEGARGWVPPQDEHVDRRYESFDFGHEDSRATGAKRIVLARNQWPQGDAFRNAVTGAFQTVERLGVELLTGLVDGMSAFGEIAMGNPCSSGRLLHYAPSGDLCNAGVGPHTDYEALTLIWQSRPGVEVWSRESGWLRPETSAADVLVFPGDSAELMTGGKIKSVLHRVDVRHVERWVFVAFIAPEFECKIAPGGYGNEEHDVTCIGEHIAAGICASHGHLRQAVASGSVPIPISLREGNPLSARRREEAGV